MKDRITFVGLDVHATSIALAVLPPGTERPIEREIPNDPKLIRRTFARLKAEGPLRCCYEAGPCGFELHRVLTAMGIPCDVMAPALIPQKPGERIKTDRRDARKLVRLYRAGELTPIRVPTPDEEAVRDLVRPREDVRRDLTAARHRLAKFLLRHGRLFTHGKNWTERFWQWLRTQIFDHPAQRVTSTITCSRSTISRNGGPPWSRQVGAHDFPFEACSGFTHVAARRLADPPRVGRCPESFGDSVTLLAASVATGANRQFPRSESPVHGAQEQSAYNGHFESVCYHPLFVFNQNGDCLAATLRPGNVHSADGWDKILLPVIERSQARGQAVVVRADAAFALPALYEALERRGVAYAIRLPANDVLERAIEDLLIRPRGRPSHAPLVRYRSFQYQAASWDRPRRVIAKVEHHLGELFPRVGFIVTTLPGPNRAVVRFYNQRGTAEQWIKEGKEATHWTRLSCHRFRANEVRLLLGVIAYNLGNLLRRLVLPLAIQSWSLTSLQQRLFKTGGRLIRHARYFILQLAESHLTRRLFRQILARIERLAWHPT